MTCSVRLPLFILDMTPSLQLTVVTSETVYRKQSQTLSPQASWSAGGRREKLWGNENSLSRRTHGRRLHEKRTLAFWPHS